ncbi:hypothetical protein ACLOJK_029878 [Asimina triloba]
MVGWHGLGQRGVVSRTSWEVGVVLHRKVVVVAVDVHLSRYGSRHEDGATYSAPPPLDAPEQEILT